MKSTLLIYNIFSLKELVLKMHLKYRDGKYFTVIANSI